LQDEDELHFCTPTKEKMDEEDTLPEPLKPHIGKLLIGNKMDNPFMKEMEMIQQQLPCMGTAKDDVLPNSGGEDEDTSTTPQAPTDGAMMEQIEDGDYDDNNDMSRPHLSNHNNHQVSVLEDHNTLPTSSLKTSSKSSTVSFRLEDHVHDDNNNTSTDVEEDDPFILPEHSKNGRRGLTDNRPRRRRRKNHRVSVLDHYTLSTSSSTEISISSCACI